MFKQNPVWIIEGECHKPDSVMCNLGYACDGCPYITDRKLLEIKQAELVELEKEISTSVKKYIEFAKLHGIKIPEDFNKWNLVRQSLYIFKNHNKIRKEI